VLLLLCNCRWLVWVV